MEAKDLGRPHLMRQIYAADAVLTFSIATDAISFPERVAGIDAITKTLIVDFGAKYKRCKTYYVCDSAPRSAEPISVVPWLVLMHEPAQTCLRIGKGYYEWTFGPQGRADMQVVGMHIHIERMDPVEDAHGRLLTAAQSVLPYPWLPPKTMGVAFRALREADPESAFLQDFGTPVDPAARGPQPSPPAHS